MTNLTKLRKKAEAVSTGRSWINILQSDGCEVQLFDRRYTIWLSCKRDIEAMRQSEKDAEFLVSSRDVILSLLDRIEAYEEALKYIRDHKWAEALPKWGHEFVEVAKEVLARFKEK